MQPKLSNSTTAMPGLSLSRQGAKELAALQPPIDPSAFPCSHPGSSVCLPSSGRRLGYCEHVDDSVPADQLRNVVLLPGVPGTRLFSHPEVQQRGYVPCWRLIVLERPGIGLSDPPPEPYGYTDFVADFREFCAVLDLTRVSVIGFSAGTPFATAVACCTSPPPPPSSAALQPQPQSQPPEPPPAAVAAADVAAAAAAPTRVAARAEATGDTGPLSPDEQVEPRAAPPPAPSSSAPAKKERKQPAGELSQHGAAASSSGGPEPATGDAGAPTHHGAGAGAAGGRGRREDVGAVVVEDAPDAGAAVADGGEAGGHGGGGGCGGGAAAATSATSAATAAAAATGSLVVEGVALVSAIGPPDTPNKGRGMALLFQFAYWACAHAPWLVGWLVRSEAATFRRRPLHALRQGFAPYSAKADVDTLKRPEVERMFLESALEMYGRGQEDAVLRENLLFAGRFSGKSSWSDFDLGACRVSVAIWQGGQDRGCTPAMATHLAQQLGCRTGTGTATAKVVPEAGHMLYFDTWQEIVDWVNALPPPRR